MKSGTDYSGFFPFGWLRDFQGDNWQIFWNKKTGHLFLKATAKNTLVKIGEAPDWAEAKKKADFLMQNPGSVTIETADC